MKKILAIFMALVVFSSFAFFAIGSGDDSSSTPTQDSNDFTFENPSSPSINENPTRSLERGVISGNVYTNSFADITFTKPSTWTFATDEELKATIDAGAEYTNYSDLELTLAEVATVYDMSVSDPYGNSVMVLYENTMISGHKKMTEDEYLDVLNSNLKTVTGMTYTFKGTNNVALGGTTFKRASYTVSASGASIDQYYYVKAFDKYIVSIIVTSTTKNIADIETMFS